MKQLLFLSLFICLSFFSFAQKRDTFNLFQGKAKPKKKDAVQEIQSQPRSKSGSVYYIRFGTIAQPCPGYCLHEAKIDSVQMVRINKPLQADKNYPAKTDSTEVTGDQWNMLVSSVEINSFWETPEKIGNTQAEAVEWIEINYSGKTHKVTFDRTGPEEYEGIKNLEKLLKRMTGF